MSPVSLSGPTFQVHSPQFKAAQPVRFGMALANSQESASVSLARVYRNSMGDMDEFVSRLDAEIRPMPDSSRVIEAFATELERAVAENRLPTEEAGFAEAVLMRLGSRRIPIVGQLRSLFVDAAADAAMSEYGAPGEVRGLLANMRKLKMSNSSEEARPRYERAETMFLDWLLIQPFRAGSPEFKLRTAVFELTEGQQAYMVASSILQTVNHSWQEGNLSILTDGLEGLRESTRRNQLQDLVNGAAIAALNLSRNPEIAEGFPVILPELMKIIADNDLPRCREDLSAAISHINTRQQIGGRFQAFG